MQYIYRAGKILEILGDIPITHLTPTAVAGLAKKLESDMAYGTVDGIMNYLHSVCTDLIALDELTTNPVTAYRRIIPKRARGGRPAREPVVLADHQCKALVKALYLKRGVYERFLIWLICLPLRVSELRGLRWANVDSQALTITIVEQRRAADKWTPVPPKSKSAIRVIPITPELLAFAGPRRDGTDLVFVSSVSTPLNDAPLVRRLRAVAVRHKLPYLRLHDLRHTAASNILRLGCPIDYERALLGHAPRDITEHYARPDAHTLRPHVARWCDYVLQRGELRKTGT